MTKQTDAPKGMTRRQAIKTSGAAAAAGIIAASKPADAQTAFVNPRELEQAADTRMSKETKTVHSVCLACNARCGVRGVVKDGKLINISGNPYHPYNMQFSPIDYTTPGERGHGPSKPGVRKGPGYAPAHDKPLSP